jgi:hypothetical protein
MRLCLMQVSTSTHIPLAEYSSPSMPGTLHLLGKFVRIRKVLPESTCSNESVSQVNKWLKAGTGFHKSCGNDEEALKW